MIRFRTVRLYTLAPGKKFTLAHKIYFREPSREAWYMGSATPSSPGYGHVRCLRVDKGELEPVWLHDFEFVTISEVV